MALAGRAAGFGACQQLGGAVVQAAQGVADRIGLGDQAGLVVLVAGFGGALRLLRAQAVAVVVKHQRWGAGLLQGDQAVARVVGEGSCFAIDRLARAIAIGIPGLGDAEALQGIAALGQAVAGVVVERALADQDRAFVGDGFGGAVADGIEGVAQRARGFAHRDQAIGRVVVIPGGLFDPQRDRAIGLLLLDAVAVEVVAVGETGDDAAGVGVGDGFEASGRIVGVGGGAAIGAADGLKATAGQPGLGGRALPRHGNRAVVIEGVVGEVGGLAVGVGEAGAVADRVVAIAQGLAVAVGDAFQAIEGIVAARLVARAGALDGFHDGGGIGVAVPGPVGGADFAGCDRVDGLVAAPVQCIEGGRYQRAVGRGVSGLVVIGIPGPVRDGGSRSDGRIGLADQAMARVVGKAGSVVVGIDNRRAVAVGIVAVGGRVAFRIGDGGLATNVEVRRSSAPMDPVLRPPRHFGVEGLHCSCCVEHSKRAPSISYRYGA